MIELSIHFTSDEKDETSPIEVSLNRRDTGTRTDFVPFTPPLGDPELADLRWYLELFSGWPTGPDYERAEGVEAQMEDWGRALLKSVIHGEEAPRTWQQFVDAEAPAGSKLLTIDAIDLPEEADRPRAIERIGKMAAGQEVDERNEFRLRTKGGALVWALVNSTVIRENGEPARGNQPAS